MAKGPLHETIQPAKSHKNAEGILQSNYKKSVSTGTEKGPDQVGVCVGCARGSPQAAQGCSARLVLPGQAES